MKELLNNDTHIFFWNGIYSNWYPAKFTYKGNDFQNSEQAFMWEKANYFGDKYISNKVLETPEPQANKALGRMVKNFNGFKWDLVKYDIMYGVNKAKFDQNPKLKNMLMETAPKTLVESSPYDKIWGIGMMDTEAVNVTPSEWKGENLLGKALTQLREDY